MDDQDKQDYLTARPYIEAAVAMIFNHATTNRISSDSDSLQVERGFNYAATFLKEFERRNGIVREDK